VQSRCIKLQLNVENSKNIIGINLKCVSSLELSDTKISGFLETTHLKTVRYKSLFKLRFIIFGSHVSNTYISTLFTKRTDQYLRTNTKVTTLRSYT
jgi:hypothetical protein